MNDLILKKKIYINIYIYIYKLIKHKLIELFIIIRVNT